MDLTALLLILIMVAGVALIWHERRAWKEFLLDQMDYVDVERYNDPGEFTIEVRDGDRYVVPNVERNND